ncbi:TetR/AcrR family transcriptional regulator [Limnobacter humi]|uniref:TetR/AcrR family transcriptional regulator n=1 Tax=Limnobacter humi TaxID=1778671 RepID=A0ABT1WG07_9BURK|nr:TetR/AcrR family transcriptional regulator [Limnobacter humi]MCQ8896446.1 TetR/AcrR family transcriptional regulator [Limnobacter humi]
MLKKTQTRMKPQAREKQLLDVAQGIFIETGYQGTTMEDIAQAAGVTRPVIYNIFGSKDAIYLACLKRARELLDDYIRLEILKATNLESRIRSGFEGYFKFVESEPAAWRFLYAGGSAVAGPAAEAALEMRFNTVNRITALFHELRSTVTDDQILMIAHSLSGAGEQLAKWWVTRPDISRQQVVNTLMNTVWNGISSHLDRESS